MKQPLATGAAPLEWQNISFAVDDAKILDSISGGVEPGRLTCILGPSGAGKSTLLNLIAGRQRTSGKGIAYKGDVLYDGLRVEPSAFRKKVAYVMQEDALLSTETPREAITFSARLRCGYSAEEARPLVDRILKSLNLDSAADTLCGSNLIKGISGGEKKRAAIAVELIASPSLIFLDEPTSGLDSFAAMELVQNLKAIAAAGNVVCMTVHQPSSELFALFDQIICLRKGRTFYQGAAKDIPATFRRAGIKVPSDHNPADFLLFQAQVVNDNVAKTIENAAPAPRSQPARAATPGSDKGRALDLANGRKWTFSHWALSIGQLFRREYRALRRNKPVLRIKISMMLSQAVVYGMLFWRLSATDHDAKLDATHFRDVYGFFTGLGITVMMGAVQPVLLTFPLERPVFLREYVGGMYDTASYVIAKTAIEALVGFLVILAGIGVCHSMIALQGNFFYFMLTAWALSLSCASIALWIGAIANSPQKAAALGPAVTIPQIFFSGLFLSSSEVPFFLRWIQYICPLKYTIDIFGILEFGDTAEGPAFLETQDIYPESFWTYVSILVGVFFGFRLLAGISLKRSSRYLF